MRRPWGLSRQKQTVDIMSVICTAVVSVAVVAYIYASGVHLTMCIHTFVPQMAIICRYMWQRVYKG
jgi:hypothetical protein